MQFKPTLWAVSFLTALCTLSGQVSAAAEMPASTDETVKDEEEADDTVIVRDRADASLSSFQHLTKEDIALRPTADGNLTDLLKSNPAVQFSNSSGASLQMGEIKPADISIHGAQSYQNNFLLDGFSINSDLDPATQSSVTTTRLGGSDEQGFYVDARLIDSLTVYDHNIPVSIGGFTGGAVDATTRSWSGENHISVFGRTTRAGWSRIHTDPGLQADSGDADVSKPAQFQTDFEKKTMGFTAEWGLRDNLGVVVGYSRRESDIPTVQVPTMSLSIVPAPDAYPPFDVNAESVAGRTKTQTREEDNFFLKSTLYATPFTEANLSLVYSGYESNSFLTTVADSDYTDEHEGINLTGSIKHQFAHGVIDAALGYTRMKDERVSEVKNWTQLDRYTMTTADGSKDVPTARSAHASGGLGDLNSTQDVVTGKFKLDLDPVTWGDWSHQLTLGADWSRTRAAYERDRNYYRWTIHQFEMGSFVQNNFYTTRWKAGTTRAELDQSDVYVQHTLGVNNWMLRTGLRADYDSLTNDVNLAPRATLQWDLLGNGNSVLTVGANRYYGRNILTYALYEAQNGGMENAYDYADDKNPLTPEEWFVANDFEGLDRLNTPYSDELSFGVTQRLADWSGRLAYVHRDGHDEVKSRTVKKGEHNAPQWIRQFYNGGESEHDSVIFSLNNLVPLQFARASHWVRFSAAWQQTKSNTSLEDGYNEMDTGENINHDYVYYDGKVMSADDLEATDFNIPVKFDLETTSSWSSLGLTWYNFWHLNLARHQAVRDEGEYYNWTHEGSTPGSVQTELLRRYSKVRFASAWSWDTKLLYTPDWAKDVGISLEVYNLTDNRNASDIFVYKGDSYRSYDPGRQFWVQLSYDW